MSLRSWVVSLGTGSCDSTSVRTDPMPATDTPVIWRRCGGDSRLIASGIADWMSDSAIFSRADARSTIQPCRAAISSSSVSSTVFPIPLDPEIRMERSGLPALPEMAR